MKDLQRKHQIQFREAAMPQLDTGGGLGGRGGGNNNSAASSLPPRKSSLTEKFQQVAGKQEEKVAKSIISTKEQIKTLQKMLSQPRPTYSYTPLGTVKNSFDRDRDRSIRHQMKEKQRALDKYQGMSQEFNKKGKAATLSREFNKQSLGRGMGM